MWQLSKLWNGVTQGEGLLVTSYNIVNAYSPSDLELQHQEALYQKILVGGGCLLEIYLHGFLLITREEASLLLSKANPSSWALDLIPRPIQWPCILNYLPPSLSHQHLSKTENPPSTYLLL